MMRLTALSILFPYTTLFRSVVHGTVGLGQIDDRQPGREASPRQWSAHDDARRRQRPARPQQGPGFHRRRPRDRKSTRLNSSHLGISYAVFCLKKKKKETL